MVWSSTVSGDTLVTIVVYSVWSADVRIDDWFVVMVYGNWSGALVRSLGVSTVVPVDV